MKAAETSASSAMADWTPLTVVSRSSTTAEIDTFMKDVSTTRTNIAMARRSEPPLDGRLGHRGSWPMWRRMSLPVSARAM